MKTFPFIAAYIWNISSESLTSDALIKDTLKAFDNFKSKQISV